MNPTESLPSNRAMRFAGVLAALLLLSGCDIILVRDGEDHCNFWFCWNPRHERASHYDCGPDASVLDGEDAGCWSDPPVEGDWTWRRKR